MSDSPQYWIVLRAIVVMLATWGIASYDASKSNVDWTACLLVSIAMGASLYAWLMLNEKNSAINWTKPISITRPVFPINQYPIRSWLLAGASSILGGSVALLKEVTEGGKHVAFGALFLSLGVAILFAIGAFLRLLSNKVPT